VKLAIKQISAAAGTQVRAALDQDVIGEYAEQMSAGVAFPPVVVFKTPQGLVLADGFHRVEAAKRARHESIEAEIHEGTLTDAVAYALKANITHGLRRSNADKRRAVEIALLHWPDESHRKLADRCGVSDKFVAEVRGSTANDSQLTGRVGKDGRRRPAQRPARSDSSAGTPSPTVPAVIASPPSTGPQPAPEPRAPEVTLPPASNTTSEQTEGSAAHADLMAVWLAASLAERSAFLRQLVANVTLGQHTAAWGAIRGKILTAHEKPSAAAGVSSQQNGKSRHGEEE
jgi:hypothetical protein